jgi:hypothetical protein
VHSLKTVHLGLTFDANTSRVSHRAGNATQPYNKYLLEKDKLKVI